MEIKSNIVDINVNYKSGKAKVTFEGNFDLAACEELMLNNSDLRVTAVRWREKRSLDANAYCWLLITKIGDKLRKSKEQVYLDALKDYGQSEIVSIRSDIKVNGYFKYYEEIGTGYVNNTQFTHYKIFKGTSEYNTEEMSIFIDGIVQDAEALGICTMTPQEIEKLKTSWGWNNG